MTGRQEDKDRERVKIEGKRNDLCKFQQQVEVDNEMILERKTILEIAGNR